jgi:DNA-directed RNA polymerase II subunit RPB1
MLGSTIRRLPTRPTDQVGTCQPLRQLRVQSQNVSTPLDSRQKEHLTALSRIAEEALPELEIEASIISLFDPDTLVREAVVKVTEASDSGQSSVNDPRMGVVDNNIVCSTCHKTNLNCPGHLGYIQLSRPILHPLFLQQIVKVLQSVCNTCGGLLLSLDEIKERGYTRFSGNERLKLIAAASEKLPCRINHQESNIHPCRPNPYYLPGKLKELRRVMYREPGFGKKKGPERERTVSEIEAIFSAISQADAEALGFANGSHPSRYILNYFPVIPPQARPPVILGGYVKRDLLTDLYISMVKINNELLSSVLTENESKTLTDRLAETIRTFIDNSDAKHKNKGKIDIGTIKRRIQSKEAIIRRSLMGKRVDYTARTVLGPEPSLKYGQIRIPEQMAPFLTQKVRVAPYNIELLTGLLRNGKVTHIIMKESRYRGKRIVVTPDIAKNYTLQYGDQVERHLMDGDYVLFNRQPTLHKQSMTGYEVVLGKPMTIGLHLSDTTPKNADFDGDEGNLHALQTIEAVAEAKELMSVKNCLMNSQTNKPSVGVVYDGITGAYLLTQVVNGKEVEVDPTLYNDLILRLTNTDSLPTLDQRLKEMGVNKYSGRGLFSVLLPEDFYYSKGYVHIRKGILINGTITKDHIGPSSGSIVQALYKDYGKNRVVDFLTDTPFLINGWLQEYGFSVGLKDCYVGDTASDEQRREAIRILRRESGLDRVAELETEIQEAELDGLTEIARQKKLELEEARSRLDTKLIQQMQELISKGNTNNTRKLLEEEIAKAKLNVEALGTKLDDPLEEERREKQIVGYVNVTSEVGKRISTEQLSPTNALNVMAISGAKGSVSNIAQITGMLGQQFILGQRMPMTISQGSRCLPYYENDDLDPSSRGFCTSSFLSGLTPAELFFHQAGGREGLMDTAIKTADTGSIHHQLIKALEDIKIGYDGSVRNATGTIFQFSYGDDGFDAGELEPVKIGDLDTVSFINVDRLVGRINSVFGFVEAITTAEQVTAYQAQGDELENERFDTGDYEEDDID